MSETYTNQVAPFSECKSANQPHNPNQHTYRHHVASNQINQPSDPLKYIQTNQAINHLKSFRHLTSIRQPFNQTIRIIDSTTQQQRTKSETTQPNQANQFKSTNEHIKMNIKINQFKKGNIIKTMQVNDSIQSFTQYKQSVIPSNQSNKSVSSNAFNQSINNR